MCDIQEHQDNNRNNCWKQRKLVCEDKLLVLHDHTGSIKQQNGTLTGSVARCPILPTAMPFSGGVNSECHMVAHTSDFNRAAMPNAFFTCDAPGKKVIVLHVASGGFVSHQCEETTHQKANFVWLSQKDSHLTYREKVSEWLPQFMKLDFDTAMKLVPIANSGDRAQATAYENDYAHLLDIILPGRIENRLAFRLLCEAYKLKKIDGESDCGGIEIHAPEDISQWLAPFGKAVAQNVVENDKAIDEVAGTIGSGLIKTKAKAVLDAVNGNGSKLDDAIIIFLKEVTKPNS